MSRRTPEERTEHARRAAQARWARTPDADDRAAGTAAARAAFKAGFLGMADAHGELPADVRTQLAEDAESAYFAELAARSARVRRERGEARRLEHRAERLLERTRRLVAEMRGE